MQRLNGNTPPDRSGSLAHRSDVYEQQLCGSARARPGIYEQWLDFSAQHFFTLRLEPKLPAAAAFQMHARSRSLEGFTIVRNAVMAGRCQLSRGATEIAGDNRDVYGLHVCLSGEMDVSQFGRTLVVGPRCYALVSGTDPVVHGNGPGGSVDVISLLMPSEFVEQRVLHGEDRCLRPYEQGKGLHALAIETAIAFQSSAWEITDEEFRRSARLVADLVLLALRGDADPAATELSVRAANLAKVKRILRRRLCDPELTLAEVAHEARISLRYAHVLFQSERQSMSEYLQSERLKLARELLERAAPRTATVTDVCLQCGFSNVSHFSTAFKRAFGASPREVLRRG